VARKGEEVAAAWTIRFDLDPRSTSSSKEAGQAMTLISKAWGEEAKKAQLCKAEKNRLISVVLRGRDLILVSVPSSIDSNPCAFAEKWSKAITP
jgi:hypothetical protein